MVYRLLALSKRENQLIADLFRTKEPSEFADGEYEDIWNDLEDKVIRKLIEDKSY